jgi:Fe-S-cluster containining protein
LTQAIIAVIFESMYPCDDCPIDDKVYECCGKHPETGESVRLRIDAETVVYACPHLTASGRCAIYENRPLGCRAHYCTRYADPGIGRGYSDFIARWGLWPESKP